MCSSLGYIVEKKQSERVFARNGSRSKPQTVYMKLCCKCYNEEQKRDPIKPCLYCNLGKKAITQQVAFAQAQDKSGADVKVRELSTNAAPAFIFSAANNMGNTSISPFSATILNNQLQDPVRRTVLQCQCQIEISYKSKDPSKCSSLGFLDDSMDVSDTSNKTSSKPRSGDMKSFGYAGAQRPTMSPLKYRRLCCGCFNDRVFRADIEPLRSRFADPCTQCLKRKEADSESSTLSKLNSPYIRRK